MEDVEDIILEKMCMSEEEQMNRTILETSDLESNITKDANALHLVRLF